MTALISLLIYWLLVILKLCLTMLDCYYSKMDQKEVSMDTTINENVDQVSMDTTINENVEQNEVSIKDKESNVILNNENK